MEEEKKPEPDKKDEDSKPLVLPPVPPEKEEKPNPLEDALENNVIITPDEIGGEVTISF